WYLFTAPWSDWMDTHILHFIGQGVPGVVPLHQQNLSEFSDWVEEIYFILGVDWSQVPAASAALDRIINDGNSEKVVAMIMAEDFMNFITYSDENIQFGDLWEHIMTDRWIIGHTH
ncbi:MAG: hypothetical protein FWD01_01585, partial [Defluviitaleaceae bacterium]|nr:hypothetical protein [Defluviitaleaceae bacterium]